MSVYLDAIKVLEERGWCQGNLGTGLNGEKCIAQAVCIVAARDDINKAQDYNDFLAAVIGVPVLHKWNDDPSTSYEDVILWLKRAHEHWEASQ